MTLSRANAGCDIHGANLPNIGHAWPLERRLCDPRRAMRKIGHA